MGEEREYLGYIQYSGHSVDEGYLDAKKAAEALTGIDEAFRFLIGKQCPDLGKIDFEIPIRIQKGSWQALIPHDIPSWIQTALGVGATAYIASAAQKMAENDFKDVSIRQLFQHAFKAIQWIIRIGKHLGSTAKRKFSGVQWRKGNTEVGIPNDYGDILFVPYEYFKLFEGSPSFLLSKLASPITQDRQLEVVVVQGDQEEVEFVDIEHRGIFVQSVDEILFPELEHGMWVELEGVVTRGNENSNTIVFQHDGHILTCYPEDGSIVRYKPALFLRSRITGIVTRADRIGNPVEPRPKIIFDSLTPLEQEDDEATLQLLLLDLED